MAEGNSGIVVKLEEKEVPLCRTHAVDQDDYMKIYANIKPFELAKDPKSFHRGQTKCGECGKEAEFECVACHGILYCSERCAVSNRPLHKHLCAQSKYFLTRPSKDHVLCLYFPEDAPKPCFIWLQLGKPDQKLHYQFVDYKCITTILAPDGTSGEHNTISGHFRDGTTENDLGHWNRSMFQVEPLELSKINRSIINTTHMTPGNKGKGGFIITAGTFETTTATDVLMVDLRHVVNYFNKVGTRW